MIKHKFRIPLPISTLQSVDGPVGNKSTLVLIIAWDWTGIKPLPELMRTKFHYDDVIMTMLASQITSLTVVYSIVYSGVNQRKHQSSASLAFVREIHRGPVNFPHKWPVTRKMFPFDDVIMSIMHIAVTGPQCVMTTLSVHCSEFYNSIRVFLLGIRAEVATEHR